VAVRPPAVPVGTGPAESPTTELTLPVPVPAALLRTVVVAGACQVTVEEDFSLQELTSQDPAVGTVTAGVEWLVAEVLRRTEAEAVTAEAPSVLR
jgi:hypothetical protein